MEDKCGVCDTEVEREVGRRWGIKDLKDVLAKKTVLLKLDGRTFSSNGSEAQLLSLSDPADEPFSTAFASRMFSCRRVNCPEMKFASPLSPVHAVASTTSKLELINVLTSAICFTWRAGAEGDVEMDSL